MSAGLQLCLSFISRSHVILLLVCTRRQVIIAERVGLLLLGDPSRHKEKEEEFLDERMAMWKGSACQGTDGLQGCLQYPWQVMHCPVGSRNSPGRSSNVSRQGWGTSPTLDSEAFVSHRQQCGWKWKNSMHKSTLPGSQ